MYFGLKKQIISFLVKLKKEIVSKYCNLSKTQGGIQQPPSMSYDGGRAFESYLWCKRFLLSRKMHRNGAEDRRGQGFHKWIECEFNTFFFPQTFLYLNCGSTTKLTLPFKIRAKHTKWKRRPAYWRKEVCAVLGRTFFLASHCLFPFMSMMSLHYKTEPLLRASSLQGYITPVLAVTYPPTNPSHFLVGPQGSCAILPLVTQN